jgi:hypothetical protein
MVTVCVVWRSGSGPVEGSVVQLGTNSGVSEAIYTDSRGEADFEDYDPDTYATIYVDGSERFEGYLPEHKTFSI